MIKPDEIKKIYTKNVDDNFKFRMFLKNRADTSKLDQQFRDLHNELFIRNKYDCCKCANCCKLYDIQIAQKEISAISEYIGETEDGFVEKFLIPDNEENEAFIVNQKPCSFLEADGKCRIYTVRPLVCRDFPNTKKPDRLFSLLGIISYTEDCPVVFEIIERLKRIYGFRNKHSYGD